MDDHKLPIVDFGKYKDKCVTELMSDTKYVEWLKKQSWFSNKKNVYSIVINQTMSTPNNSKTPEHNMIQNIFLSNGKIRELLETLFGLRARAKAINNLLLDPEIIKMFGANTVLDDIVSNARSIFEEKYNWDVAIYFNFRSRVIESDKDLAAADKEKYKEQYGMDMSKTGRTCFYDSKFDYQYGETKRKYYNKMCKGHGADVCCYTSNTGKCSLHIGGDSYGVFCEIKPILSDDYPCVLRKMKTQISVTSKSSDFNPYKKVYVLLVGSFSSNYTTEDQLIAIFKQSEIKVIFINDISKLDKISKIGSLFMHKTLDELIAENSILSEQLLITQGELLCAKEKITQLEYMIKSFN
jgi:hypothetical protein